MSDMEDEEPSASTTMLTEEQQEEREVPFHDYAFFLLIENGLTLASFVFVLISVRGEDVELYLFVKCMSLIRDTRMRLSLKAL